MDVLIEKLPRHRGRIMASFIVDDVRAATDEEAGAFVRFSRWVEDAGLRGECSAICGLCRTPEGSAAPLDETYAAEVTRATSTHLDAFMEVMTLATIYDFPNDRIHPHGPHEGVWLNERTRDMEEYLAYFESTTALANAAGFRHSGLTQPGCGCPLCVGYFFGNHLCWDAKEVNSAVWDALLELARRGALAAPVAGAFVGWVPGGPTDMHVVAEDGPYAIYDVRPGTREDAFRQDEEAVRSNIDGYITEDGEGGRFPELIEQGTRTLIYFTHWGNIRPGGGAGFDAFQEVANRLMRHYGDRLAWMRPTEIAAYRHTERHTRLRREHDGFWLTIPFEPSHPLTFRISGATDVRLKAPDGAEIAPSEVTAGNCALYEFDPENGKYTFIV